MLEATDQERGISLVLCCSFVWFFFLLVQFEGIRAASSKGAGCFLDFFVLPIVLLRGVAMGIRSPDEQRRPQGCVHEAGGAWWFRCAAS